MEHTLNHGMCRCCASEGMFKNFSATYQWMGADEVYADMLKECFDITLTTAEDYNNGGICEVCITQLRNASNFKKQVLQTEEQFKKTLQDDIFKTSIVKEELNKEDGDYDSDNNISEDFSGTEYEVPIKEELSVEQKPKKRSAKASTSSAKRAKKEDGEPSNKRQQRQIVNRINILREEKTSNQARIGVKLKRESKNVIEENNHMKSRKKYEVERAPELTKNRINLKGILQYSNASLVRCRGDIGYACCFCENQYPDPADLKRHTIETHDYNTMCAVMRTRRVYTMKMDITALQCNVCDEDMYDLEQLIDHLVDSHQQPLHKNVKSYILPFKFESDVLQCYICLKTVNNYKALIEHMNSHFRNFVCDICDAGFFSKDNLRVHSYVHDIGSHTCAYCPKQFNSIMKKKTHERLVHVTRNMVNKCGICNERFNSHYKKIVHLKEAHGVDPVVLDCKACDRTFTDRSALRRHVQSHHLLYRPNSCTECDMKFYKKIDLEEHMVKHTGVKNFKCDICSKSYGRRYTLREHMRIHLNDRRFKCEHCGKAFVQKCSWKGHMRAKHGEEVQ